MPGVSLDRVVTTLHNVLVVVEVVLGVIFKDSIIVFQAKKSRICFAWTDLYDFFNL